MTTRIHVTMYQNIECGNILTWEEMVQEGKELYDLFDDTNIIDWSEYYTEIETEVEGG